MRTSIPRWSLLFLLVATPALAQETEDPASSSPQPNGQKSTAQYLTELDGDDAPERLYAARVLRGQLRHSLAVEAHARPGSLASDDARAVLVELIERLPIACTNALAFKNTVASCADVLVMLDARGSLPVLEQTLAGETRKGARKHLEKAIAALTSPPAP